jgi:hypothetical protein
VPKTELARGKKPRASSSEIGNMMNDITLSGGVQYKNADVKIMPRYRRGFDMQFVFVFRQQYQEAMNGLSGRERDVFDVVVSRIHNGNICRVERSEIAKAAGMSPTSVSKAITSLIRHGVILKHHDGVFEVDPGIMWMGKVDAYYDPPKNPNRMTHQTVKIMQGGKLVGTLHYPIVLTNEQVGRLRQKTGVKNTSSDIELNPEE